MANIALCWDLGSGAGHLAKLTEVCFAARLGGHTPILIVKDICLASSMSEFDGVDIYQAPLTPRQAFSEPVLNYSGVLRSCGFQSAHTIAASLTAWFKMFELLKIECVVADHSPAAILAAKLLELPAAMIGSGFSVPPIASPLPSMRPWQQVPDYALQQADQRVLTNINQALGDLGRDSQQLENVAALYANAEAWLHTLPEVDYQKRDSGVHLKRSKPLFIERQAEWQQSGASAGDDRSKVFVYFDAASAMLPVLFKQLVDSNHDVLAVVPGASPQLINQLADTNIQLHTERFNINSVAEQCDILINTGGHGLVVDFLLLGKPCLMLPDTLERTLMAYTTAKSGLGFAGTTDPTKLNIQEMIRVCQSSEATWQETSKLAKKYQTQDCFSDISKRLLPSLLNK